MKRLSLPILLALLVILPAAPARATRTTATLHPPTPAHRLTTATPRLDPNGLDSRRHLLFLTPSDRTLSAALAPLAPPLRKRLLAHRHFQPIARPAHPIAIPAGNRTDQSDIVWSKPSETPVLSASTAGNDRYLHGRTYLPDPALYDYRARFYEPATGTFLELDPLGPVDSPNLYQAFGFDGLNVRDPFGLQTPSAAQLADGIDDGVDWTTGVLCHGDPMCLAVNNRANGLIKGSYDFLRFGDKIPEQLEAAQSGNWTRAKQFSQLETMRFGQLGLALAPLAIKGQSLISNVEGRAPEFGPSPRGGVNGRSTAAIENGTKGGPGTEGPALLTPGQYQQGPVLEQGDQIPLLSAGESGGLRAPNLGMPEGVSYEGFVYRGGSWRIHRGNLAAEHRYSAPGRGALYTSLEPRTAVAELQHAGVPLGKIRLQGQSISVENLLNLADPTVRRQLGVSLNQLTSEDYGINQALGDWARARGYNGIIAPSARRAGGHNLVLFKEPQ